MAAEELDDVWEVVHWPESRMSVDILLDDPDDDNLHRRVGLAGVATEVLLAFTHDLDDFPWLASSWSIVTWLSHSVLFDDLGNLGHLLDNLSCSSHNSLAYMSEEILDDVWEVVFWRIFRVHVDMAADDLDDGHSD